MSDTLLSGRKRRESHKPKTFSPEPAGPSPLTKKTTPKNVPKLSVTPKSAKASKGNGSAKTTPKTTKSTKKTSVNSTPVAAPSTFNFDDEPGPSSSTVKFEDDKKAKNDSSIGISLRNVVSKKPSLLPTVSNNSSKDVAPFVAPTQRGLLSLRKPRYESNSEDDSIMQFLIPNKSNDDKSVETASEKLNEVTIKESTPSPSSNIVETPTESFVPIPSTSMGPPVISKSPAESISPSIPTSRTSFSSTTFSLRTGRERRAPPSKDYDPNGGSNNRRNSINSAANNSNSLQKRRSKTKSITVAPMAPDVVSIQRAVESVEVQREERPLKLSIRIPKSITSQRQSAVTTPVPTTSNGTMHSTIEGEIRSGASSSVATPTDSNVPLKVPPIRLALGKHYKPLSRSNTPAIGNSSRPSTPKVSSVSARPMTPQDVSSMIRMATTSRSGRVRKPPPSKEYPGHDDLPMTSSKRQTAKIPTQPKPKPPVYTFSDTYYDAATTSGSISVQTPLSSAPAMSLRNYATNFDNRTSMFEYPSPLNAPDPTPAPTPIAAYPPHPSNVPMTSFDYYNPPSSASFASPSSAYIQPSSLAENVFNRPSRNKCKPVLDLAPSLVSRDMLKRASIATTGSFYQQQYQQPSASYQVPATAGTASHMFAYPDDYVNGYNDQYQWQSGGAQKRRATGGASRPLAKRTKSMVFDSSAESIDTEDLNIDRSIIDYGDDAMSYLGQLHPHFEESMKHIEDDYEDNFFYREILTVDILSKEASNDTEDSDINIDIGEPLPIAAPRSLNVPPVEHSRASTKLVRQLIDVLPPVERKTLDEIKEWAFNMLSNCDGVGLPLLDLIDIIMLQYSMELSVSGKEKSIASFYTYSVYHATRLRNILFSHFSRQFMEAHALLLKNLEESQLGSYLTLLKFLRPAGTTLSDMFVAQAVDSVAITYEVMSSIVVEKARDPYIRMLTQVKRRLKKENVYIVLVYPGISFDDETISPIYHAHEQIFLGLSNIGAFVEKLAIHNPFPKGTFPNMNQACDYAVQFVRHKLTEIVHRRPGDRIFVAGWGLPCLFVHEAVLSVSGISGIIDLAIPMLSPHGNRGIVGDKMLYTYCPSLLIIGEEAKNSNVADVTDNVNNFIVKSGLIIVGAADDGLIVNLETLTKYNITQACINRLIIHHIMDFMDIILENTTNEFHTKVLNIPCPFRIKTDYAAHVMREGKEDIDPVTTFNEDIRERQVEEIRDRQVEEIREAVVSPPPALIPEQSNPILMNGEDSLTIMSKEELSEFIEPIVDESVAVEPVVAVSDAIQPNVNETSGRVVDIEMELESQRAAAALAEVLAMDNVYNWN